MVLKNKSNWTNRQNPLMVWVITQETCCTSSLKQGKWSLAVQRQVSRLQPDSCLFSSMHWAKKQTAAELFGTYCFPEQSTSSWRKTVSKRNQGPTEAIGGWVTWAYLTGKDCFHRWRWHTEGCNLKGSEPKAKVTKNKKWIVRASDTEKTIH